ncbi:MAG TPA: Rrf2 family transcriptional regulator [Denitromonas sp.]|uniref:Rrf2 family transcriptional regulator n=1 Tax=Denitromonas sp. TaxID=2734609 RepID=UPI001DCE4F8A|nr:Rrf2 family transcriptional regulator [Rhodocyclaceae bacterium]MCP5223148.1 Rrf2 family transcriptional regulator [Zoogloeaceae bacterium]HPR06888.1 Rrf2 family transcriptional regulator [Denitromonas sp.]HQU90177.1 Rrf2 family transcriptional regulator [Denitromonas sp.]HQV16048.1 Rrf2 family transcriptional regulator [Denitromonas sp.]
MQITQYTDYALRVLIYLGACPERRVTIKEIAETFDISRSHVMKIVNQLVTLGFVEGTRGKGGGLRLNRAPAAIGVGEVVRLMEPGFDLVDCFRAEPNCLLSPSCRLKGALQTALQAFLAALDEVTLADLIVNQPRLRDMLGVIALTPAP